MKVLRIKQPGSALADTNIILTGKGVRLVKVNNTFFHRVPYECMSQQGVLPSVVKPGSPDYVDVICNGVVDGKPTQPEFEPLGVFQLVSSPTETVDGSTIVKLKQVEFVRNKGV